MLAALYDAIERYEFSFKWENKIPVKTKELEYYFDEISVDYLRELLNDKEALSFNLSTRDHYCSDCGGSNETHLKIVYNLSEKEKEQEYSNCINYRKASKNFILKCLERNPDQKDSFERVTKDKEIFKNFYK